MALSGLVVDSCRLNSAGVSCPRLECGSDLIELAPEVFDQYLCINPVLEPLHREALIPQLPVKGLVRSVLPGLAWIDVGRVDLCLRHPAQDRSRDELRAVVRSEQ